MKAWPCILGFMIAFCSSGAEARGLCDGAPDEYVMEPVRAKIADAETGAPIQGAIVVAFWKVEGPRQFVKILESVTDASGGFFFPGWGPMKRLKADDECFYNDDPYLKIFKPGYKAWGGTNETRFSALRPTPDGTFNGVKSKVRKSQYNGTTIKLQPFVLGGEEKQKLSSTGETITRILTEKDWCDNIRFILSDFAGSRIAQSNISVSVPKLLNAIYEQKETHPVCFRRGQYGPEILERYR